MGKRPIDIQCKNSVAKQKHAWYYLTYIKIMLVYSWEKYIPRVIIFSKLCISPMLDFLMHSFLVRKCMKLVLFMLFLSLSDGVAPSGHWQLRVLNTCPCARRGIKSFSSISSFHSHGRGRWIVVLKNEVWCSDRGLCKDPKFNPFTHSILIWWIFIDS